MKFTCILLILILALTKSVWAQTYDVENEYKLQLEWTTPPTELEETWSNAAKSVMFSETTNQLASVNYGFGGGFGIISTNTENYLLTNGSASAGTITASSGTLSQLSTVIGSMSNSLNSTFAMWNQTEEHGLLGWLTNGFDYMTMSEGSGMKVFGFAFYGMGLEENWIWNVPQWTCLIDNFPNWPEHIEPPASIKSILTAFRTIAAVMVSVLCVIYCVREIRRAVG